ncbi:uncharacterized protein LOC126990579 isoform X18 [Eriocheir sinensis]|uniref:uncharacterized protein LOC126990579 isoform X10 n=1 Tax=Eriocheir sinensis TaxID=95602 RepID=UPI0021C812F5|nr:uncharacterized protein LOC126990579 isoform X10 [Eriocheir sinensis]XP_050705158.1 uncharacterized protein LOC126990579 isoform X11 [Eriocheir sinensis]XP_050705159.1 uncharacterized protein LOC126990579 isoform X12 [Eriocheir sinensis]XP_050705160.1 uncharacterized protein LOC126990579 isoform X13 [Eriocheir sinensis]XP_050705161.1 uncharacterized protein LOC126990579 isoform X14 [Eriocheir sinensis]XP_050705162.1 uncharacterized protein LOC126990579 isoform X15 [Eriocheir sinensis]XP_05
MFWSVGDGGGGSDGPSDPAHQAPHGCFGVLEAAMCPMILLIKLLSLCLFWSVGDGGGGSDGPSDPAHQAPHGCFGVLEAAMCPMILLIKLLSLCLFWSICNSERCFYGEKCAAQPQANITHPQSVTAYHNPPTANKNPS